MSIKILTKNGVENTNIDGARDCNFNAGNRSGIVKSVLNEGRLFSVSSNTIGLDTCELRIFGHRIVIDEIQYKTFTSIPSSPVRYALVAQVSVTETVPTFALNVQSVDTVLHTDNINNGNGIYEIEFGRFTHNTDGSVTDIVRTIDIITGGISGGNSEYISIGAVTTDTLDSNLNAEVDVENRKTPEGKMITDFSFGIPRGKDGIGINSLKTVKDISALMVTYSYQDGITIYVTERYTYSSGQVDVETERKIPIGPGYGIDGGIVLGVDSTNDRILIKNNLGICRGRLPYSLAQKRINSKGEIVTTDACQQCSAAFGGGTVAGDPNGDPNANSFAFAANENTKAPARGSAAFGRYTKTHNPGEFVCGNYTEENRSPETVFLAGGGVSNERRHNALEVRTNHSGGYEYSDAYIGGKMAATQEYVGNYTVHKKGTSYVVYANEADGKSVVIPYRFQKKSIVDAEYVLMFQPMINGRLYTRDPTDEYHVANKRYVDAQKKLYKHTLFATNAIWKLLVVNNSSEKITTFTSLLENNYISMRVGTLAGTPVLGVGVVFNNNMTASIGIKVKYYDNDLTTANIIEYLDSNFVSDTVTAI